jgi:hypothetical protein
VFLETGITKDSTNSDVLIFVFSNPSVTLSMLTGKRNLIFALTAHTSVARHSRQKVSINFLEIGLIKLILI